MVYHCSSAINWNIFRSIITAYRESEIIPIDLSVIFRGWSGGVSKRIYFKDPAFVSEPMEYGAHRKLTSNDNGLCLGQPQLNYAESENQSI